MGKTQEHSITWKTEVVENYRNHLHTDWKQANQLFGDKYQSCLGFCPTNSEWWFTPGREEGGREMSLEKYI